MEYEVFFVKEADDEDEHMTVNNHIQILFNQTTESTDCSRNESQCAFMKESVKYLNVTEELPVR